MSTSLPNDGTRWWQPWLWLGLGFGSAGIVFNALFARFPLYGIQSGNPALVIPLGSAGEIGVSVAVCLGLGALVEIARRLFRGMSSWHLGAQVALALCLEAYVVRMLLAVRMRNGLFRFFPPPQFDDGWILGALAAAAVAAGVGVAWWRRRDLPATAAWDHLRLVLFVSFLASAYAVVYHRWMSTTRIPLPRVSGWLVGLALAAVGIGWGGRRRGWSTAGLVRIMFFLAVAATAVLTVYYALPGNDPRSNLVVILWDAARASRMSLYGYDEPTTPGLESLARRGVVFDAAYSPSNYTYPSHVSLFLGRSYRDHNYHIGNGADVARYQGEFTLADRLRQKGFHTALFTENSWVLAADKGFEEVRFFPLMGVFYDEPKRECEFGDFPPLRKYAGPFLGRTVLDALYYCFDEFYAFTLDRIQLRYVQELLVRSRRTGPVFLFCNWMTVHDRYHPYGSGRPLATVKNYDFAREYALSLKRADERLMDLHRLVERCGQGEKTILIVTSDHGEFLGENNLFGHNKALFEPVLRVPFAVFHPAFAPRRVARPVSLISFRSLLESSLDQSGPPTSEWAEKNMTGTRPVIAEHGYLPQEWSKQYEWAYAVIDEGYHYVYDPLIGTYHSAWPANVNRFLFPTGISQSPESNRAASDSPEARRLEGEYAGYRRNLPEGKLRAVPEDARKAMEEKLRALGYLR